MDGLGELVVKNLLFPMIKDLVQPKIKSILEKYTNSKTKIDAELIEKRFEEYITRRYEHFSIIDTLVFPNQQTLLKTIYQPLTVTDRRVHEESTEIRIDGYPAEFIPQYYRVIIEDTAGMGKSTITKRLFQAIVEQNAGIPVLIELRHLNAKNKILKEIQKQLAPIGKMISQDIISKMIDEGGFIFLFDGFDEIANRNRDFVIKELHSFIEKANENYFLITSRTDNSLSSFGSFKKFRIKDLEIDEAYNLISRYDIYNSKKIAKKLIERLENNLSRSLKEYLTNPLLVSLLYKSFEYKKDIPIKKSQFYSQVYDALFETHDLSKEGYLKREKSSNLHMDDFERVLRLVGYFTAVENVIEYDKDFIIQIIDRSKNHLPDLKFKSSDFLKDLLHAVPLFKQEGNYYRWSHKSLQDYFAAKFIWVDAKENQDKILRKIFDLEENERFYNLLDIYYELDPTGFDATITFWLLTDFCDYASNHIDRLPTIPIHLLKERIENTYAMSYKLVVTKSTDYDSIQKGGIGFIEDNYCVQVRTDFNYRSYHHFVNSEVIVASLFHVKDNIQAVMSLLYDKKPDLFLSRSAKKFHRELLLLEEGKTYIVDMDAKNVVNHSQVFKLTNELVNNGLFSRLSYDNAFKELERIKKTIKTGNEFVDW